MNLDKLIKDLDEHLVVRECKKKDNIFYITCESNIEYCKCPYCEEISHNVHSRYLRTLTDLSIQNNEVKLILNVRKFFCSNDKCSHKTFGERFDFVETKAVRTKRLDNYINSIGIRDNSMDTVRTLKETGIKISSNTVLRIVKKKQNRNNIRS